MQNSAIKRKRFGAMIMFLLLVGVVAGFGNEISYVGVAIKNSSDGYYNGTYTITTYIFTDSSCAGGYEYSHSSSVVITDGNFRQILNFSLSDKNNTFYIKPSIGGVNETCFQYTASAQAIEHKVNELILNSITYSGLLGFGNLTTCSNNEILKMSGGVWTCSADTGGGNSTEQMQDAVMSAIDDGTQTGITVSYDDGNDEMDFIVTVVDTNESTRFQTLVGTDCTAGYFVSGINNSGGVVCAQDTGVGNGNSTEEIVAAIESSNINWTDPRRIFIPSGTGNLPSLAFEWDPDTGFYILDQGEMGIVAGGQPHTAFSPNGIIVNRTGTADGPQFSHMSDENTGLIFLAADVMGFSAGGMTYITFNESGTVTNDNQGNNTIKINPEKVHMNMIMFAEDDQELVIFNGSQGKFTHFLHSIRINATNCDTLDTTADGTIICGSDATSAGGGGGNSTEEIIAAVETAAVLNVDKFNATTQVLTKDGAFSAPGYSFYSDTDTGITHSSAELYLVHGGTPSFWITETQMVAWSPAINRTPQYSFQTSQNTGLYLMSNEMGLTGGGNYDPIVIDIDEKYMLLNASIRIHNITSCTEALETDANGNIICGTDATGSSGGGNSTEEIRAAINNSGKYNLQGITITDPLSSNTTTFDYGSIGQLTIDTATEDNVMIIDKNGFVGINNATLLEGALGAPLSVRAQSGDATIILHSADVSSLDVMEIEMNQASGGVNFIDETETFNLIIYDDGEGIAIQSALRHAGEFGTNINFTPDRIEFDAGNLQFIDIVESAADQIIFNGESTVIDFIVESDLATHALFVNGSNGHIGFNNSDPQAVLDVNGAIRFDDFLSCTAIETDAQGDLVCGSDADTTLSDEQVQDKVGAMWKGTEDGVNVTYDDTNEEFDISIEIWRENYVFDKNVTVEALHLENDAANHHIKDNSTCVIIKGDTSTLNIC